MARQFHLIVKAANGVITHRMLDVNQAITLQATDIIIYQEMADSVPTSALTVRADGEATT